MSREVDQRVVEMQFNNAQFERNTKQSINTIERLKASLNFDGVSNSFAGITKAAKNVNLEPVSDGANEVYYRFKALDVVAGTVLSNITTKAMTLGWTLAKALTIDPMKTGLAEYETQINSVQTILANTQKEGTNLAQVNAALDELNRYADMTIYNFTEMTRNIGTFTAAGVKLDTSVQAIKGIANLAAVSGSTSQQASTAMYQLSQALAAGTVKLMDWNSVVNAGMGGQVFQDALKETARVHGVAIDEMIAKEGSFRETLQYGWLTASILTETLAKFTGDLSEEELRAIGYTEDQIAAIIKMGETANDAATKVKTFTQLIDTLKEAVQSGWTQSWEYIIGDFEEAKELWTEISDRLQAVIGQSAEARNALLQGGLQSGLNQFIDQGITDYSDLLTNMLAEVGKAQGAITDEEIEAAGGLAKTLKSGWLNADMLESSLLQVVKEARDLSTLSDEQLEDMSLSREKVNDILKQFTELEEKVQDGTISIDEFIEKMNRPSGRENLIESLFNVMDSFGKLMGTIKGAFDEVFPPMTAETLYKITESIRDLTSNLIISDDTADKLRRTFKGLFSIAKIGVNIISTLARAIGNTVRAVSNLGIIQGAASQFLEITSAIGDFLSMVEEATRGITKIGDGFGTAASKVGSVKDAFVTIAEAIETKFTIPEFETPIKTLTANFDSISKSVKDFGFSDKVVTSLEKLITLISTSGVSAFTVFGTAVGAAFYVIRDICINITDFIPKVISAILEFPTTASEAFKEFSVGVSEGANRVILMLEKVMEPFIKLRDIVIESLESTTSLDIYRILSLLDVGLLSVMVGQLAGSTKKLSDVFKDPVTKTLKSIAGAFDSISGAVKSWQRQNTIKSIQYVAVAMLALSGALYVMSKIDLVNMAAGLGAIVVMTATLVVAMSQFRKSLADISTGKLVGLATVMVSIAGGAVILANAISELVKAIKPSGEEDLATNVLIFTAAVSGLTVLMVAVGKLASMMSGTKAGVILTASVMLISLSGALKIMASAVSSLATINAGGLVSGLLTVLSLLSILTYVVGKVDFSGLGLFNGLALIGFATSLYIVVSAIGKLAAIPSNLAAGVASVAAVITSMGAVSIAMQGLKFTSGAAMIAMATSILVLYQAIKQYSKLKFSEFASGGYKVAAALTALTVAAIALSRNEGGVLAASVGLIGMSAALSLVEGVIKRFAEMNFLDMAQGLIGFGVSLGGMVVTLSSLTLLGPGLAATVSALDKLSLALIGMSAAFAIFNMLDLGGIAGGLLALVGVLGTLIIAGTLIGSIPTLTLGLVALGEALDGLSKVFLSFAAASASLALASAALGVLAMFAGPISQAIVGAAPDIGEALIALITMLCNVIANTIDPILDTIGIVIVSVADRIGPAITSLWDTTIYPALSNLSQKISDGIHDLFIDHDYFGFTFLNPEELGTFLSDLLTLNTDRLGDSFNDLWIPNYYGDDKGYIPGTSEWDDSGWYLGKTSGDAVVEGFTEGLDDGTDIVEKTGKKLGTSAARGIRESMGIHSPSRVAEEDGEYVAQGYANGIRNGIPEGLSAISDFAVSLWSSFRNFWGIHSPSDLAGTDGEFVVYGYAKGMWSKANYAEAAANAVSEKARKALANQSNADSAYESGGDTAQSYIDGLIDRGRNLLSSLGLGDTGIVADAAKEVADEYANSVESNLQGVSTSSGVQKTPSEIIEDKYKDQLEANKTLKEIADAEYELWMTENQNGAAADEILAKNLEHVSENIELQTKRVELSQAKYDEIVKAVGADAQEAKEAYSSLLDEKNTLASLKAEQYTDLYDDIINRLSVESDRLNKEYELWGSENPGASDFDKTAREIQNVTDQLSVNAEELKYAEQQYQVLLKEYGESDLRTQEAHNEWLDARIEVQDKQNELLEKQLEQFDNAITAIERQSSLYRAKTDLLATVYDDGDLSTRAEDYVNAVETYGENSPEALRAKYQGSSSAVLGVAVAMRNMADQMKKTSVYMDRYQALLDSGTASAEELAQAQENILSSQASFVGFAEDLADAFDMDEAGKEITVKLAYAISNNWDTIYGGFKKVWSKIEEKFPELASNLSKTFGDVFSEEGAEIATSLVSTVTNALSGDYASAIIDALNTILSFVGSDMGSSIISSLTTALGEGIPEIGNIIAGLIGSGGGSGIIAEIGASISGLVASIGGSGGLAAAVEGIGAALASVGVAIPELLPIIAIVAAVGGAIAFLISNWDELGEFLSNLIDNIVEFGKNLVEGFVNGIKKAWEGITNFIGGLFGGIIDFVKGIFGIDSPSKEFFALGEYIDQGFADGIASSAGSVSKSIFDMTSSALTTADMMSSKLASTLSAGGNYSYAIEPVVDLSDLEDSRNWLTSSLSGLNVSNSLDTSRSARLASDTALRQNQNGKETADSTRADVVAAIGTLSDRVVTMGRSIEGMQVVLDSKKLVGGISGQMDSALGVRAARARRGG